MGRDDQPPRPSRLDAATSQAAFVMAAYGQTWVERELRLEQALGDLTIATSSIPEGVAEVIAAVSEYIQAGGTVTQLRVITTLHSRRREWDALLV